MPTSMFQPLHNYVLLLRQQPPTVTASGLHIPESNNDRGTQALVLAAGPGKRHPDTGIRLPMQVRAGDTVIITKHQNSTAEVAVENVPPESRVEWGIADGDLLLMLREGEVLAVLATANEAMIELGDVVGEQTADAGEAFEGRQLYPGHPDWDTYTREVSRRMEPVIEKAITAARPKLWWCCGANYPNHESGCAHAGEQALDMSDLDDEFRRRDEIAEERSRRYTHEDGSAK